MKNSNELKNPECPFTEIFTLILHRPKNDGIFTMRDAELKIMQQHIDNSMEILLRGLQGVGQLLGVALHLNQIVPGVENVGYLIALTTNLIEALAAARSDTEYLLTQRSKSGD